MTAVDLAFVNTFTDSRGKQRHVFRRKGFKRVSLPGDIGSSQFMTAYAALLSGGQPVHKTAPALRAGTIKALAHKYYETADFKKLAKSSKRNYEAVLEEVCREHGDGTVSDLPPAKAAEIIEKIGSRAPGVANVAISVCAVLFDHAIKVLRWRTDSNPFRGIERYTLGEHHCWTDKEITQYEKRWAVGTRQRLAFALLLYTAQRVGDTARMTEDDVQDGLIHVVQEKTGTKLWIPIHPELAKIIKATPRKGQFLLPAQYGPNGIRGDSLSDLVVRSRETAALPDKCVPHGLRKAACRRLAEAGCTAHEIAAISGHKSLKEIERYTKAASQIISARAAMKKIAA